MSLSRVTMLDDEWLPVARRHTGGAVHPGAFGAARLLEAAGAHRHFYIVDRKKDMIIGAQVWAAMSGRGKASKWSERKEGGSTG